MYSDLGSGSECVRNLKWWLCVVGWKASNVFCPCWLVWNSWDLNTKLVQYWNGWKEFGCHLNTAIWKLDSSTIWIPYKWMPSCFLVYWFDIWMVSLLHRTKPINRPSKYQIIWNHNFKKFGIQMFSVLKRSPLYCCFISTPHLSIFLVQGMQLYLII